MSLAFIILGYLVVALSLSCWHAYVSGVTTDNVSGFFLLACLFWGVSVPAFLLLFGSTSLLGWFEDRGIAKRVALIKAKKERERKVKDESP